MNGNLVRQAEQIPGPVAPPFREGAHARADRRRLLAAPAVQPAHASADWPVPATRIERQAARRHIVGNRSIPAHRRPAGIENREQVIEIDGAEHVAHLRFLDLAGTVRNRLIEQRQRIAHAARGRTRKQIQRAGLGADPLDAENVLQMAGNQRRRHLLEIELQAARQHRDRDLLRIGRRQDELDVLRRLFQRLQHRVEGRVREHVHFVDHVDLEAAARRRIDRVLEKLPHLVDLGVGRRVDFEQIDKTPGIDLGTRRTGAARRRVMPVSQLNDLARILASVVLPTPRVR
jgi:hypothetical protein